MTSCGGEQAYFDEVSGEYEEYYNDPQTIMDYEKIRRLEVALSLVSLSPADEVLVIGVGSGELFERLPRSEERAIGVDFSRSMLELSRERAAARYVQGAVQGLPLAEQSVDALVCLGVVGYLDDEELEDTLAELSRVLAPGGQLVLSFANAGSLFRRLRQFYYELLEWGKRLTGLGDPVVHRYSAFSPARIKQSIQDEGLSISSCRYLTYATGLFNTPFHLWIYRVLEKSFADVDQVGQLAMTWVIHATKPTS